jgi:hypothetical protein
MNVYIKFIKISYKKLIELENEIKYKKENIHLQSYENNINYR